MSGIGHLGEIKTIDFLRKKMGFAIYLPLTDKGIDFVGVKGEAFYQFQVKTSMFQKNSYFWFDLYKHRMVYSLNTYYVFVCATMSRRKFMGKSENYIVIPSLKLKEWIRRNQIASKQNDCNCFNIFLYPDQENMTWKYRNKGKELDWTSYWNKFDFA